MDKQKGTRRGRPKGKPNTTSSMKEKGYSSSSHYRINPTAEKSEQVLAIKFVQWDVLPLESLCNSKVYFLRMKLNRGERMSREEGALRALPAKKRLLYEAVNSKIYSLPMLAHQSNSKIVNWRTK